MNTNKGNKMVQFLVKILGIQVIIRHLIYDLKQAWATPGPSSSLMWPANISLAPKIDIFMFV